MEDVLDLLAYIKGSDHGNICFFRVYRRGKDGTAMLVVVYRGSLYSTQVREFNCDESEVLEILTENGYEFLEFCWL